MCFYYLISSTFNIGIYGVGSKRQLIFEFLNFLHVPHEKFLPNSGDKSLPTSLNTPKKSKRFHPPNLQAGQEVYSDVFAVWSSAAYYQIDGFDASLTPVSVSFAMFDFSLHLNLLFTCVLSYTKILSF